MNYPGSGGPPGSGWEQGDKQMGGPPIGSMQNNGPMPPPGVMMQGGGGGPAGHPMSTNSNETPPEISLRPARNFTVLKPNTPSMLPKSAQINIHSHTPPVRILVI